jgi:hypothetical protein
LEDALNAILEPHGLGFSVEADRLSVWGIYELEVMESTLEPRLRKLTEATLITGKDRWPEIRVVMIMSSGRFSKRGDPRASLRINGERGFVFSGDRFGNLEVVEIDVDKDCIILIRHTTGTEEEREFCQQVEEPEWPEIEFMGIVRMRGQLFARLEVGKRRVFMREGEELGSCRLLSIDMKRKCITMTLFGSNGNIQDREFCLGGTSSEPSSHPPVKSEQVSQWPVIEIKSIFDPTKNGTFFAILEVNNKRIFMKEGERLYGLFEVTSINGETNCLTIVNGQGEAREFCKE